MDFGPLRALVLDLNRTAHGVPATVTLPEEAPVETVGIWLTPDTMDLPGGGDLHRRDAVRIMALGRDQVPRIVRGTIVEAPETPTGAVLRWRFDGIDQVKADCQYVYLVPDPELVS